jgi:SRSO17 transposase
MSPSAPDAAGSTSWPPRCHNGPGSNTAPGQGSNGPRDYDPAWVSINTATPWGEDDRWLLIRRHRRTGELAFYLCWAPPQRPASMTYFITIAGRRWPVEETFKTGKDVFGWDQTQARTWNGTCRHTALAALAQLRAAAIRNVMVADAATPLPTARPPRP